MPFLATFTNPTAWHILSYGTLLGTTVFNSFIAGIIQFKVLPRPNFSQLQQKQFPWYFGIQTLLPVGMALTWPFPSLPGSASYFGIPGDALLWSGTLFAGGLLNWVWIGPWTTSVMRQRKHQETKDGKRYWEEGEHTEKMKELNTAFSVLHGVSSLINLLATIEMFAYGFIFAERARF